MYDALTGLLLDKRLGPENHDEVQKKEDHNIDGGHHGASQTSDATEISHETDSMTMITGQVTSTNSSTFAEASSNSSTSGVPAATSTSPASTDDETDVPHLPHWSYEKSSIAAASFLIVVFAAAMTFLATVYFRKIRRHCIRRRRKRREDSSAIPLVDKGALSSDREAGTFTGVYPPPVSFVAENSDDGNLATLEYQGDDVVPFEGTFEGIGKVEIETRISADESNATETNMAVSEQRTAPERNDFHRASIDLGSAHTFAQHHADQVGESQPSIGRSSDAAEFPALGLLEWVNSAFPKTN